MVVVCDGDNDGSAAACAALRPALPYELRIIEQTNQGPAAARNRGVQEARHELIVFLDDDVVPDDDLLAAHREAHAADQEIVTIGPLLPPQDAPLAVWAAWEERTLCRQYAAMGEGRWEPSYRQFYTGNAAVRRRHILAAGGFNARFRRAEDVELALRLHEGGRTFRFLPQARAHHYIERSFRSWLHGADSYGAADVAIARSGRPAVLKIVCDEFGQRRGIVRFATRCCVRRPRSMCLATVLLSQLIAGSNRWHWPRLGNLACGLLFNLRYYDALADALGGRQAFDRLLRGDIDMGERHDESA